MKRVPLFLLLSLLCLVPLTLAKTKRPARATQIAFTHITVIDATGSAAKPDMTVVITGNRITAIGSTGKVRVPRRARIVNAEGKFLIPGLWDMHAHHQASGEESLPLFIANGVTGTRDMGSDLEFILSLRRKIAGGVMTGPRIVAAGPMLDNAPTAWPFRLKIGDEVGAREAVRLLKRKGVDFIKVHTRLPRRAYFAAADEAKKQGLTFAGHVPEGVTLAEAAETGQKSVEHLSEYGLLFECSGKPGVSLREVVVAYSAERCRALFEQFKQTDTWQTPTLAALQTFAKSPGEIESELRAKGYIKYVGPTLMGFWVQSEKLTPPPPEEIRRDLKPLATKAIEVVGEMNRQGVNILAGCDALTPGFCLHDELELMIQAGLSPMEALQTATRNPARFFGKLDTLGTVERGKIADLVILEANPLENIGNIRRINSVVVDGRYFSTEMLRKMLAEVESTAARE